MLAAAPWIRDALKTTNDKAKLFEAQASELSEKNDALQRANSALKSQVVRRVGLVSCGSGLALTRFFSL